MGALPRSAYGGLEEPLFQGWMHETCRVAAAGRCPCGRRLPSRRRPGAEPLGVRRPGAGDDALLRPDRDRPAAAAERRRLAVRPSRRLRPGPVSRRVLAAEVDAARCRREDGAQEADDRHRRRLQLAHRVLRPHEVRHDVRPAEVPALQRDGDGGVLPVDESDGRHEAARIGRAVGLGRRDLAGRPGRARDLPELQDPARRGKLAEHVRPRHRREHRRREGRERRVEQLRLLHHAVGPGRKRRVRPTPTRATRSSSRPATPASGRPSPPT